MSRDGNVVASFPLLFQSCSLLRCVPRVSRESSVWERGSLRAWVGVSTAAPYLYGSYSPTQVASHSFFCVPSPDQANRTLEPTPAHPKSTPLSASHTSGC